MSGLWLSFQLVLELGPEVASSGAGARSDR